MALNWIGINASELLYVSALLIAYIHNLYNTGIDVTQELDLHFAHTSMKNKNDKS